MHGREAKWYDDFWLHARLTLYGLSTLLVGGLSAFGALLVLHALVSPVPDTWQARLLLFLCGLVGAVLYRALLVVCLRRLFGHH
jgi:hypothetical protein